MSVAHIKPTSHTEPLPDGADLAMSVAHIKPTSHTEPLPDGADLAQLNTPVQTADSRKQKAEIKVQRPRKGLRERYWQLGLPGQQTLVMHTLVWDVRDERKETGANGQPRENLWAPGRAHGLGVWPRACRDALHGKVCSMQ